MIRGSLRSVVRHPICNLQLMSSKQVGTNSTHVENDIWKRAARELNQALEEAARSQRLMSYTEAASAVRCARLDAHSVELVRLLCERVTADVQTGRPLLSSIVIGQRSNRPGKGFFRFAGQYFHIDDEEVFWLTEVDAVHRHYGRRSRRGHRDAVPDRKVRAVALQNSVDVSETDFIMSFFD